MTATKPLQGHRVTLASPELPAPIRDLQSQKMGALPHLSINTTLSNEEAIGFFHRNYAPPSLTPKSLQLIKQASDTVENPGSAAVIALIGPAGGGKTSAAVNAGYLVDGRTPYVFQCGNLDELLWESILNNSGKSLIGRLEERFNDGTIHPLNRTFLQTVLPEAITKDEHGREILDLGLITPERIVEAINHTNPPLDLEGISAQTSIDITFRPGPLIRVWEDAKAGRLDRPCRIIVDELDKRTPGSGKTLQQVWLVLGGMLDSITVVKNGEKFTFDKKEIPSGFSVVLTGNDMGDLGEAAGLSQSQLSRMRVINVPALDKEDLEHRITQQLTGIPFTILDTLPPETSDLTKINLLMGLRTMGKAAPPTGDEIWMIENFDKTKQAAKQMAKFFATWAYKVNPLDPKIDDPDLENNRGFREPPDVRMIHRIINDMKTKEIMQVSFEPAVANTDPLQALLNNTSPTPKQNLSIGARLCSIILDTVVESSPSTEVRKVIMTDAMRDGLTEELLEEGGENLGFQPISTLLDNMQETLRISPTTRIWQKNLYAALVTKYPELSGSKAPSMETILPAKDLQAATIQQKELAEKRKTDELGHVITYNPKYINGSKKEKPLEIFQVLAAINPKHVNLLQKMGKEKMRENLMETSMLRVMLETPEIGTHALDNLWNKSWQDHLVATLEKAATVDSVGIGAGTSDVIRVAKILTKNDDGEMENSLVFQSKVNKVTWLISETGPVKSVDYPGGKFICMPASKADEVEGSILAHIPNLDEHPLNEVLWALSRCTPDTPQAGSIKDYIRENLVPTPEEVASKNRSLTDTKLLIRMEDQPSMS